MIFNISFHFSYADATPQEFIYDKVFDQCATQVDVFNEVSQLVQSALDGHQVLIFH